MVQYWPLLPDTKGIECPVPFSKDELETLCENEGIYLALNAVVDQWRDEIGASEDGLLSNAGF